MSCMNYALRLSKNENKGPLGEKEYFEDSEEEKRKIKELIQKIRTSKHIVVHAGAGISTSSGLQDFRGPTGIWTNEFLNDASHRRKKQLGKRRKGGHESSKVKETQDVKMPHPNDSQNAKTKKIRRSSQGKCELSDDPSEHSSVSRTEKSPFDFVKIERPESLYEDDTVQSHWEGEGNFPEYRSKHTRVAHGQRQDYAKYQEKEYLNGYEGEAHAEEERESIRTEGDKHFVKEKEKSENSDMTLVRSNVQGSEEGEGGELSRHVCVKKENATSTYEGDTTSLDRNGNNEQGNSTGETENPLSNEHYVIFGNRKKKVIDLHLALPTKTHIMIKELMKRNVIKFLITQNIDSLHYRCGTKFSKISEIHGNIFIERCDFCGRRYLRDFVISTISFQPTGALCFLCSFPPIGVCTDVLLDWNNAYEDFFHLNSIRHSQMADFHFCLGSSFYIVPASYYPSKKKFANENSYSCLINYQKSSLSKEVDLSLHSNVNNISDVIIKEFSLEPLCIRSALIVVVRCQIIHFDLIFDELITVKNVIQDGDYVDFPKGEISSHSSFPIVKTDENSSLEEYPCSQTNQGRGKDNSTYDGVKQLKEDRNSSTCVSPHFSTHQTDSDGYAEKPHSEKNPLKVQIFLIKCSMIKNVNINEPVDEAHKLGVTLIDKTKGIWLVRTNFCCVLEIELWYKSFVLLKLNYDENCPFVELNAWSVDVAYTYGDDIDDVDYVNSRGTPKSRNFDLHKNKYVDSTTPDTCSTKKGVYIKENLHSEPNHMDGNLSNHHRDRNERPDAEQSLPISEILPEHVYVGYNPNNIHSQSGVEQLAILTNASKLSKHSSYERFELPNALKLLYNLFCLVNKTERADETENERKNKYFKREKTPNEDTLETFVKNMHSPENINLYTTDFIKSFTPKESISYRSHYTFRERKKRNLSDFNLCSSSDENKEKKMFVFYNLYMKESSHIYNIVIQRDIIRKRVWDFSLHSSYSPRINSKGDLGDYSAREEIHEASKINDDHFVRSTRKIESDPLHEMHHVEIASLENCKNCDEHENVDEDSYHKDNVSLSQGSEPIISNNPKENLEVPPTEEVPKNYNIAAMEQSRDDSNTSGFEEKVSKPDKARENYLQEEENDACSTKKKSAYFNHRSSELLFYPVMLINSKHQLGELVSKVPKYIKPQRRYTPYRKLSRDRENSNTLQRCRSEIWQEKYNEMVCDMEQEHTVDFVLLREVCYFPLWLLNYVNDLFECL
ncbi:transcriptional regulatory protein sir2b, putative [Plasmodium knowlesi strain H]|uniref:protein acetyllysine N-acetyltransferase n=3 Tax=Plasmodium knowlesi TaxID=5850 RepID=A0A5K1VA86_PLAKH|nr:transcriptional regulatory protein sir2b, putative [Plasmodium knowlesi strain H]OTN65611.1 putative Transcriptional regulatory protein sir2b [Plasmodium knowlesi]CAA9989635.1 transcriptional regulatory protein sir2b, putative [Plasmodium knowlesi strain H]SBO22732.1 transcriptional regulatory protein sir2b, putative [Plasmodium knowlesi strain H]SBO23179.1 transcriptional regulatory protein sir2b, putative [Plasmodium knowlesi strain H]VVS79109.1 transcriptional regulatory protein sir2b, p|eukprot:XP_002260359.1 hypothetical protein, conserved in Plasmodium species [Plasmodium knowlesi strain H]